MKPDSHLHTFQQKETSTEWYQQKIRSVHIVYKARTKAMGVVKELEKLF